MNTTLLQSDTIAKLSCLVVFLIAAALKSNAQSAMLDNGFSVKFSLGFPPSQYGYDGEIPLPSELDVNNTFGLEIGSMWEVATGENVALAVDLNWFDLVYSGARINDPIDGELYRVTAEISLLEIGPAVTYAFSDLFALQGYYNLRPTFMGTAYFEDPEDSDDYVLASAFNFMHGLGVGARFKFIYLGYEYTFGSVNGNLQGEGEFEDASEIFGRQRLDGANSKLIIGFQF
ncbi:MAG: hypothetical protein AAF632_04745 [Bacteroidota bacterium]